MRRTILNFSLAGTLLFGIAFALSWLHPIWIERVALVRPRAGLQLLLPAAALAGGVLVTAGLYLFAQDWLHTILFDDYVGLAYIGWLGVVALLLADILGNRARVTTRMVNVLLQSAGAAATAAPC